MRILKVSIEDVTTKDSMVGKALLHGWSSTFLHEWCSQDATPRMLVCVCSGSASGNWYRRDMLWASIAVNTFLTLHFL